MTQEGRRGWEDSGKRRGKRMNRFQEEGRRFGLNSTFKASLVAQW